MPIFPCPAAHGNLRYTCGKLQKAEYFCVCAEPAIFTCLCCISRVSCWDWPRIRAAGEAGSPKTRFRWLHAARGKITRS